MVALGIANILCLALALFPLIAVPAAGQAAGPPGLAVPFEINAKGQPTYGDTKFMKSNMEMESVTFGKNFPFGDKNFTTFYINPLGAIRTQDQQAVRVYFDQVTTIKYDVVVFARDVGFMKYCGPSDGSCGVFYRYAKSIDSETKSAITDIIKRTDLDYYLIKDGNGTEVPVNMHEFNPDPELTLVVTWYNVPELYNEEARNTFQGIITSDGIRSYAILSYVDLQYPVAKPFRVGAAFGSTSDYCRLPIDLKNDPPIGPSRKNLLCQSNAYRRGTYVIGLNENSHPRCIKSLVLKTTCADCKDKGIRQMVTKGACPMEKKAKVCGNQNDTFDNMCEFRKEVCSSFGASRNPKPSFQSGKCPENPCIKSNGGCEDRCMVEDEQARCYCSNGKNVRNDGKSCDWSWYYYMATDKGLVMKKDNMTIVIPTDGTVSAMTHDYNTNTFFFSTEVHGQHYIKSFNPTTKFRTIVSQGIYSKVLYMLYDDAQSTLYFSTGGDIKMVTDIYGQANVSLVYSFMHVSGMAGEHCEKSMFVVDDSNNSIYRWSEGYSKYKAIVTNLHSPKGLAIDYLNHKLYWYSNAGFEESNYDGSCRRVVSNALYYGTTVDSLFFMDGQLYYADSNSVLTGINVKSGTSNIFQNLPNRAYTIGMISPNKDWSKNLLSSRKGNAKIGKEFKIKFTFNAFGAEESKVFMVTKGGDEIYSVTFDNNTDIMVFATNFTDISIQLNSSIDQDHKFEVGTEKNRRQFRFYVRMDDKVISQNQTELSEGDGYDISQNLKSVELQSITPKPFCPIKNTCDDKCMLNNGGCEDKCNHVGNDTMCRCSDDKWVKDDGKTCQWKDYFYVGSENNILVGDRFLTHTVLVSGKVTANAFDYETNTLFFATENKKPNGTKDYTLQAFQPKDKFRTILDSSKLSSKITFILFDSDKYMLYLATDDGKMYMVTNFATGMDAIVKSFPILMDMSNISGLTGEQCYGYMFVADSGNGSIYAFNENSTFPLEPVVTGLTGLRGGLTLDYVRQLIYWYSDAGFEESKYDGSCRRLVVSKSGIQGRPVSMVYADTLYWTNDHMLYGHYSLMRTDINTGISTIVARSEKPLYGVTYIYPEKDWNKAENPKFRISYTKFGQFREYTRIKLFQEYKVTFKIKTKVANNYVSVLPNGPVDHNEDGLKIFFVINGTQQYYVIPTIIGKQHSVEIIQENVGGGYYFFIKLDSEVIYKELNPLPEVRDGNIKPKGDREEPEVMEMMVRSKKEKLLKCNAPTKACQAYCSSNTCEDKCTPSSSYPGYDRCSCSDGKHLKPDQATCDWRGYMYMGGFHFFVMNKGSTNNVVNTTGNVLSMDHDFKNNMLFYILQTGHKYSIERYNPKAKKTVVIGDLGGPADYLSFDPFQNYLYFSMNQSLYRVENLYEKNSYIVNVANFSGEITGIEGEPCNQSFFVVVGSEGKIYRLINDSRVVATIGLQNPQGLTIDYVNHKLLWSSDSGLEESSYDGGCRRVIASFGDTKPHSVHLSGRKLIWSNLDKVSIVTTNIDTGVSIEYKSSRVYSLGVIFDRSKYPEICPIKNKECEYPKRDCNVNNGGCYGECKKVAGIARCSCPYGTLKDDQEGCDYTGYMLYAQENSILFADAKNAKYHKIPDGGESRGVEFDFETNMIFYTYTKKEGKNIYINSIRCINGSSDEELVYLGSSGERLMRLAFDSVNKDMYVAFEGSVGVIEDIYNSSSNGTIKNITETSTAGIGFNLCSKKLIILDTYSNSVQEWNGTVMNTIPLNLSNPRALGLELYTQKMYIVDGDEMFESNFNGKCKRSFMKNIDKEMEPYGFQIFPHIKAMYMTDTRERNKVYTLWNSSMLYPQGNVDHVQQVKSFQIKGIFNRMKVLDTCSKNDGETCTSCGDGNNGANGANGAKCDNGCDPNYLDNPSNHKCSCKFGNMVDLGCVLEGITVYGYENLVNVSSSATKYWIQMVNGTALSIEFDVADLWVYYSSGSRIYKFSPSSDVMVAWDNPESFGAIEHMSYDAKVKKVMYFTTEHYLHQATDGVKPINVTYFGRPSGVAYDVCQDAVYVTCAVSNGLYMWKDGELKTILKGLNEPKALTIDAFEQLIYFFEGDKITQTNFDGSCKMTVAKGINAEPAGLNVNGRMHYMLWVNKEDQDGKYHIMTTTFTGETKSVYSDEFKRYDAYTTYDRDLAEGTCPDDGKPRQCKAGACRFNNGGCEDKCVEIDVGKHRCECTHGVLKPDMKTCDFTDFVLSANGNQILMSDIDMKTLINHTAPGPTRAVEFDYETNTIYYTTADTGSQLSQLCMFNNKGVTKCLYTSPNEMKYLAFDSATKYMYYATKHYLYKINIQTENAIPMRLDNFKDIVGLAFDPCGRKVFVACGSHGCGVNVWIENKGKSKLEVHGDHILSLAIDIVGHKLYVYDTREGILRVNYDGSCMHKVNQWLLSGAKPYDMEYFGNGDYVMWTDTSRNYTTGMSTMYKGIFFSRYLRFHETALPTYGIKRIFDRRFSGECPVRMACDHSACQSNGGCENICHLTDSHGHKSKCYCKYGGKLREDGKRCDHSNLVYMASGRYLLLRYGKQLEKTTIFHRDANYISSIAHSYEQKGVFFAVKYDNGTSSIFWKNEMKEPKLIQDVDSYVQSMAFDQEMNALYYVKTEGPIHRIFDVDNSYLRKDEYLFKASKPSEILLSYCRRELLYIDNINGVGKAMKIKDGNNIHELISYGHGMLSGITIDRERNFLYWYSPKSQSVNEVNGYCERPVAQADDIKFMVFRDDNLFLADGKGNMQILDVNNGMQVSMKKSPYPVTAGIKLFYQANFSEYVRTTRAPTSTHMVTDKTGSTNDYQTDYQTTYQTGSTDRPESTYQSGPTDQTGTFRPTGSTFQTGSIEPTMAPSGRPSPDVSPKPDKYGYVRGDDGTYYKYYAQAANWSMAESICRSEGASLAIIDSPVTYGFIRKMFSGKDHWIWVGGRDENSDNTWRWANGMPVRKTYWQPGQPNGFNGMKENCMAINPATEARFYDAYCSWRDPHFLCQRGDYLKGTDGYYYKIHEINTDWADAEKICKSEGGHLAVVDNQATFEYLSKFIKTVGQKWIWIGGLDKYSNQMWKWVNGKPVGKGNWQTGEPNNFMGMKEDCIFIDTDVGVYFYDGNCNWKDPTFICQRKKDLTKCQTEASKGDPNTVMMGEYIPQCTKDGLYNPLQCDASSGYCWCVNMNTGEYLESTKVGPGKERPNCSTEIKPKMKDAYRQGYDGNYYKYFSEPKPWKDAKAHCTADDAMLVMDHSEQVHTFITREFPNNFWIGANDKDSEYLWRWVDGKNVDNSYWCDFVDYSKGDDRDCAFMTDGGKWNQAECDMEKPYLCQRKGSFDKCSGMTCPKQILYPFGRKHGDNAIPRGDEEYAHLKFEKGIPFYSRKKSDFYIHTNGHITADQPDGRWDHSAETIATYEIPIAAIYMMDLTTEGGGDVFYRVTTDSMILQRIAFEASLHAGIKKDYKPKYAVIITWNEVACKSDSSNKLTFQVAYHTDGIIAVSNMVYARLDVDGGMVGFSEGKCNQYFNPAESRQNSKLRMYGSNIGIDGIHIQLLSKPECGILTKTYPVEVKYKKSESAMETSQLFYFNGNSQNAIAHVFTQTISWDLASASFATGLEYTLDAVKAKYVYYSNNAFEGDISKYTWGVATLIVRESASSEHVRKGKIQLPNVWNKKECRLVNFQTNMDKAPVMLLNAMIKWKVDNPLNGLTNVWLQNVSVDCFSVCYKGMVDFFSPRAISVDYFALTAKSLGAIEIGSVTFTRDEFKRDGDEEKKTLCKGINFQSNYPKVPAVFVTAEDLDGNADSMLAWVKDIKKAHTIICLQNSKIPMSKVNYVLYGETDKCSTFNCSDHLECHIDDDEKPTCGCKKDCADYFQETFCASNFHTYRSQCEMDKHLCEMKINAAEENIKMIYPGECKQYPYQTGIAKLKREEGLKSAFCKVVDLESARFHNESDIQILLTATWDDQTMSGDKSHDATASWTEDVTTSSFKACVMVAGRHFFDSIDPPSIHWVAYQTGVASSTPHLEVGTVRMKTWYTGSRCHFIQLKKYTPMTKVLVSVEHSKSRQYTNAMTAWVEKATFGTSKYVCKVCARELQNFDGVHEGVKIHYMAIHDTVDKYIVEPTAIHFERQEFTEDQAIPPVCKTVKFNYNFPKLSNPTVIISAVNTTRRNYNSVFSPHDIAVWIEGNNDTHLTACFKSIRAGMYREEVTLQYAIWPTYCESGWTFHDGYCYMSNDTVANRTDMETVCQGQDSKLIENASKPSRSYFINTTFDSNLVCEKDADLLKRGCPCVNNGTCKKEEKGVECDCEDGYIGKYCEKRVQEICRKYKIITDTMLPYLNIGVWYRYPGRRMVEYCPRGPGCASIDRSHPEENEGPVTSSLIYGNYPKTVNRYCTKGYGTVMINNCGDFYVYMLNSVEKKELGTNLCFERHNE